MGASGKGFLIWAKMNFFPWQAEESLAISLLSKGLQRPVRIRLEAPERQWKGRGLGRAGRGGAFVGMAWEGPNGAW